MFSNRLCTSLPRLMDRNTFLERKWKVTVLINSASASITTFIGSVECHVASAHTESFDFSLSSFISDDYWVCEGDMPEPATWFRYLAIISARFFFSGEFASLVFLLGHSHQTQRLSTSFTFNCIRRGKCEFFSCKQSVGGFFVLTKWGSLLIETFIVLGGVLWHLS